MSPEILSTVSSAQIKSILYVEDEKQYGEAITQLHNCVHKRFYGKAEFKVVPSWSEAITEVANNRPSVVLLDLGLLPDTTQEETLELFRIQAAEWPPVMVLTGNIFDLDLRRVCILYGADDFMIKTEANRDPEQLCERIYNCFLRGLRHARA